MSKIESRLESKYRVSLIESIEQFQKFDSILRETFGEGADGLEKGFLKSICKATKSDSDKNWFSIEENLIKKIILESYGDEENVRILDCVNHESMTITNILSHFKFPKTSGYRRINNLIRVGLLVEDGYVVSKDSKKIPRYCCLFDSVRINFVKNKINVDVRFEESNLHESKIMQVVFNL